MDPYSDFDDVFTGGPSLDRQRSTPSPRFLEAPQPLRKYPTTAYDFAGPYGSGGSNSAASYHGNPDVMSSNGYGAGGGVGGAYGAYGCVSNYLDRPTSAPFGGPGSSSSSDKHHNLQHYMPKLTGDAIGSRGGSPAVTVLRGYDGGAGGNGGSFVPPPSVPETPEPLLQIDSPFLRGSEYRREKTFQKQQQQQDGKKGNWWGGGGGQKTAVLSTEGTGPAPAPATVVPAGLQQQQQQSLWNDGSSKTSSDPPVAAAGGNGPAWLAAAARAPVAMAEGFMQAIRPQQQQQPQGPESESSGWQQLPPPPPQQQQWPKETQPQWWHQQPSPQEQQQQQQQQPQQQQQQPAAAFKTAVTAVTAAAAATASNFWWARQPNATEPPNPQAPMERQASGDTTVVQPWRQPQQWSQNYHQHQQQEQAGETDDPFAPPSYRSSSYGNYGGGSGADAAAGASLPPAPGLPPAAAAIVMLRARVTGTAERGEGREAHTAYEMQVEALEVRGATRRWTVSRRYREFQDLHKALQAALSSRPEVTLPQLPPKEIFGGRHKDVVSKRLAGLPSYIDGVLAIDNIRAEECVQLFFGMPVTAATPRRQQQQAAAALPPPLSAFARAYGRDSVRFEGFLRLKDWWGPPKESINLFELGVVGWSRSWVVICGGPLLYCFKGQEADPSKPQWSLPPTHKRGDERHGGGGGSISANTVRPRVLRVELRGQNYEKDQKRLFAVECGKRALLCQVESEEELQRWAKAIDPTAKLSQSPEQQWAADAKAAQLTSIELKGKDNWRIAGSGSGVGGGGGALYYHQHSEQSVWEGMHV